MPDEWDSRGYEKQQNAKDGRCPEGTRTYRLDICLPMPKEPGYWLLINKNLGPPLRPLPSGPARSSARVQKATSLWRTPRNRLVNQSSDVVKVVGFGNEGHSACSL